MTAALQPSQLAALCDALGWEAGTYDQVLADVRRLKALATQQQDAIQSLTAAWHEAEDMVEAGLEAAARQAAQVRQKAHELDEQHRLLTWSLWKIQQCQPLAITQDDVRACREAFDPEGPALLVRALPDGVEVRVTTHADARMRRAYDDSQTGTA